MSGWASVAASLCLSLAAGPGGGRPNVAVAPVQVRGDQAPPAQIDSIVGDGLRASKVTIVRLEGPCDDLACWREAAVGRGATTLVVPSIEIAGADQRVSVVVYDPARGEVLAEAKATCDLCGRREFEELASDVTTKIRRSLDRLVGEPGLLQWGSTPPGADVFFDGEKVGVTPFEYSAAPGEHTVRVVLPGHHPVEAHYACDGRHARICIVLP